MKKFIAFLLILVVIALQFNACKPKAGTEPDPIIEDSTALAAQGCLLITEKINGAIFRSYQFDSTGQVQRMFEFSADSVNRLIKRYTFEYDKTNLLVKFRETNLAVRDQSFQYEIEYDADTRLMKKVKSFRILNSGARADDTISIDYNTQKRVNKYTPQRGLTYLWDYDSTGNATKFSARLPGTTVDSTLAIFTEYDGKVNVYAAARAMQLLNLMLGNAPNRQNVKTFRSNNKDGTVNYLYNEKGLPTEAIVKLKSATDTAGRTTTYNYEYQCR